MPTPRITAAQITAQLAAGKSQNLNFKDKVTQQKLPGWQPQYDANHVLPFFFVVAVVFISVGIALIHIHDDSKEWILDYTDCHETIGDDFHWYFTNRICADVIRSNASAECYCRIRFRVNYSLVGEVFMYYRLSNFYQNHLKYANSRDDFQLFGNLHPEPSQACDPFVYSNETGQMIPIAPCGAVANSMFNDKLWLYDSNQVEIPMIRTGISWDTDRRYKFRNPPGDLKQALRNFSKPIRWKVNLWELDLENEDNNGFQNEDLIVWMRVAAFPTFRKLYRRVDHKSYGKVVSNGTYLLKVEYNFETKSFGGTKEMILATTSILGGKNYFLGLVYTGFGVVSLLMGLGLIFIHRKYGVDFTETVEVDESTSYLSVT